MQSLDQLRIGRNVKEILECDLESETHARDFFETQLTLVEQLGLPLYAQKHVGELERV